MQYNLELIKNKKKIIGFSTVLILLSLLGILYSTFNTSYKKPINLGMDFVGGNELRIERVCEAECSNLSPDSVFENLREISKNKKVLNNLKLQFQNNNKIISIRTPYLSIEESNNLITNLDNIIGPLNYESKDSRLIGLLYEVLKEENKIPNRLNKIRIVEKLIIFFLFFINSRLYVMRN